MRRLSVWLAAVLGLSLTGCLSENRRPVLHELPPLPTPVAKPLPQPHVETPLEITLPLPSLEIAEVNLEPSPPIETPAPKPVPRRRAGTTPAAPPATTQTEAETPPAPTAPAETPQLGEILTDDMRHQYENDFTGSVTRAQEAVSRASTRQLSAVQQVTIQRIRTFLQQAEASRPKDLVTALQLARRADLLGQDLLKSLQ